MRVMLTGGSGFVGLALAEHLLRDGHAVRLFDLAPPPDAASAHLSACGGTFERMTGDVREPAELRRALEAFRAEALVHAAAVTAGADRERSTPAEIAAVNLSGTINALQAAVTAGVGRVVVPSTGSVYGEAAYAAGPLREDEPAPRPVSLYGITKFAAERSALRLAELWQLDVRCVRLSTVFGAWEYATGLRDTLSPVYQATRAAMRGEAVVLPRECRLDWIYSRDVAAGLAAVLQAPSVPHRLYNLSPGTQWTLADWCASLQTLFPDFVWRLGEPATIDLYGTRDRAPLDGGRLASDLGFRARFGLDEAFIDYMAWLSEFPDLARDHG